MNRGVNQSGYYPLLAIIFLSAFFFICLLSIPGLQINDEWITTNQLHQLVQGHQVLTNEGKYGSYLGDISPYFKSRNNILGYSMALPLMALGPMLFFMALGDFFRLAILFIWSLIPVIIALIIHACFPGYSRLLRLPLLFPAMGMSLILLFINLPFYRPFPSSILDYPLESAALVFTANILFCLLCVILFLIGIELFQDKRIALFLSIALISCSSYLYWGSSGKDHMLSVLLIAVSILYFIRWITSGKQIPAFLGFFFLGLTAWVRPELGVSLCIPLGVFFIFITLTKQLSGRGIKTCIYQLFPISGFFGGLIPFFLNNYFLTGNPLYSPFLEYIPNIVSDVSNAYNSNSLIQVSGVINEGIIPDAALSSGFSVSHILSLMMNYYTLNSTSVLHDLKGIFLFADNGSMPVAALCPLLLIGLISIPLVFIKDQKYSLRDKQIIIFCLCAIIGIFLAYIRSFEGLHTSEGIAPDIRYLAPLYIPGGIIGLLGMKYWNFSPIDKKTWIQSLSVILIGSPLILIGLLIYQPFGGGFFWFNYTLSLMTFGLLLVMIIQFFLMELLRKWNNILIRVNLLLMLILPVAWQIMMVFLFSIAKFDGYTFWIPMSELIINSFIVPVT